MRVLIAGGGTGGHLFPGIALAEEVVTRHPQNDAVFVGTNRGLEARVVPKAGYPFEAIPSRPLRGVGVFRFLLGLLTLPFSFIAAVRLLWRYAPDVVVGVGGYSSGPLVLCAWLLRIPVAIQEQNALPGFTNRVLSRFADAAFLSFAETAPFFTPGRALVLGNPTRRGLFENFLRSRIKHDRFSVLIFGGSLGAKGLNARVLEALDHLGDLKGALTLVHQTGRADLDAVKRGYESRGWDAAVVEFIDDMSAAYAKSDLVICRAGATTIAELTCCRRASILVPFPAATDDHQAVNARALVEAGAALMFRESELSGERLAQAIRHLRGDPSALAKMEKAAGTLAHPEAAREITDVLVQLAAKRWGPSGRSRSGAPLRPGAPQT